MGDDIAAGSARELGNCLGPFASGKSRMSITDETRKLLWGRSGDACAKCKGPLTADPTEVSGPIVLGEEAHIVSPAKSGPRHRELEGDFDAYNNLILLCPTDHTLVDKQGEVWTEEVLRELKATHEKSVRQRHSSFPTLRLRHVDGWKVVAQRVESGKQLMIAFGDTVASISDYPDPMSSDEAPLVGGFLQNLYDWREVWGEIGPGERIACESDLSRELDALEAAGFVVYVGVQEMILEGGEEGPLPWHEAIVVVRRRDEAAADEGLPEAIVVARRQDVSRLADGAPPQD